jgi:hypothetical protein
MPSRKPLKERVKGKVKAMKEKIKSKVKGAAKAAVALSLFAVVGCATSDPASRMTTARYGDIDVRIAENVHDVTVNVTIGDGALASADSEGSTESITASPTNDVKPQTEVDVPLNKASGAGTVGSVLGDAAASAVRGMLEGRAGSSTSSNASDCSDGSCSPCADGSCNP